MREEDVPETSNALEEAKMLIQIELGIEMSKYPIKSATPAFFGPRPQPNTPVTVNSGSASLLRLKGRDFALTCSHVLEGFRKRLEEGPIIFQLGNCEIDPLEQLAAEDEKLDFALIELTETQAKNIARPGGAFEGKFFTEPPSWPPPTVKEGEFVAFGGFPGELRRVESFRKLSFGSYSSGAAEVTAAGDDYLVCQFERDRWVKHEFEPEPSTIRGMSGGPVFAIRRSESDIISYEFIGHIYEFSEDYELLYIRLARAIPL